MNTEQKNWSYEDKLESEYYSTNTVAYPTHEHEKHELKIAVDEFEITFVGTVKELETKRVETILKVQDRFKNMKSEYRKKDEELHTEFRKDIAESYGVADNPKKDKLFEIAWDMGHSAGLREVDLYYSKLVELVR